MDRGYVEWEHTFYLFHNVDNRLWATTTIKKRMTFFLEIIREPIYLQMNAWEALRAAYFVQWRVIWGQSSILR